MSGCFIGREHRFRFFLFIFIAVGYALIQERRENKKLISQARERELRRKLQIQQL